MLRSLILALLLLQPSMSIAADGACPIPVRIDALDARGRAVETGSGFLLPDGRRIVTAAHVVAAAHSIRVETPDGLRRVARTTAVDRRRDVALIRLRGRRLAGPETLLLAAAEAGQPVETIGHVPRLGFVTIAHRVKGTGIDTQLGPALESDTPWVGGISGAPVVDRHCRIIGLASFAIDGPVPHYYAIPADAVAALLHDA